MTKKRLPLFVMALGLALGLATVASSQEDMRELKDPAFAVHRRAPAAFTHDAHNQKAGIDDCSVCHHGGKNGVLDRQATSEGTPCADCHPVTAAQGVTPLARAWHRQCMGCHRQTGKGPLACGACHTPARQ